MLLALYGFAALLTALGPVVLAAWWMGRGPGRARLLGLGAVAFVGAQLLHLPFNHVAMPALEGVAGGAAAWLMPLALGLSAGFFEEGARMLVLWRFVGRDERDVHAGLTLGLGHGGVEAAGLIGLTLLATWIQILALGDSPAAQLSAQGLGEAEVAAAVAQIDAYRSAPLYAPLVAPFERVAAMVCHVGFQLLVMRWARGEGLRWAALAFVLHAALDAGAVAALPAIGVLGMELLLAVCAGLSALFIRHECGRFAAPARDEADALDTEAAIHTDALGRRFGDLVAVEGLSLRVPRGEVLGFVGPNGAGKTTTMRMLAGLLGPSAGEALVLGHRLDGDGSALRAKVGILTEKPGHYERLDALTNLSFHAALFDVPEPREAAEGWLRRLGLFERRHDPVGTFSKGMRQRLAIARALIHEPDLLFFDEPTSGLDPESANQVRALIRELAAEGKTIFLCTHHLEEAERLADRVAVFRRELLALDSPDALRSRVRSARVRMRVEGDAEAASELARALEFVREVERQGAALEITLEGDGDPTPDLIATLAARGVRILEVRREGETLEAAVLALLGPSADHENEVSNADAAGGEA